jgi:hypothetical protein
VVDQRLDRRGADPGRVLLDDADDQALVDPGDGRGHWVSARSLHVVLPPLASDCNHGAEWRRR